MLPRRSRGPTLFPYTTLFRSRHGEKWRKRRFIFRSGRTSETARKICARQLDRKSTRLNSSHVAISYAVFCLKKKMQITGGQANPAPPVGPALGQHGVNLMEFC